MSVNDRVLLDSAFEAKHKDVAPEMRKDDFFELFLAEQLLWERELSWEELLTGVTGGSDDGGLDAIYIFCNDDLLIPDAEIRKFKTSAAFEIVVIQAKTSASFSEVAVEKMQATLMRLLDLNKPIKNFTTLYNAHTISLFEQFRNAYVLNGNRFPTVDVKIYYGSRGFQINRKVILKSEELRGDVASLFSEGTCTFSFITPSDLVAMARRRRPTTLDLKLKEVIATTGGGFVGLASITDYFDFMSTDEGGLRTSIFESNVRDYEGNSGVNASIKKTLEENSGEEFWWLNNGVTIVASRSAAHGGRTLTLEYPQVVNGLQTSQVIHDYVSKIKAEASGPAKDERSVLIRVVVPPSEISRDRIIRATNSQTAIPSVALRATDSIQRKIEEFFLRQGWFYERRKNRYQNENKPLLRIITIPYLAEAVLAAILGMPHLGNPRLGGRFLRDDALYERIFNDSISLARYLKSAQLCRRVESYIRDQAITRKAERRNRKLAAVSKKAIDDTVTNVSAADTPTDDQEKQVTVKSSGAARQWRRRSGSQRYLLPTVMALAIAKTTDSDLADLDVDSVTDDEIESWMSTVESLDPTAANRGMKPETAEALLVDAIRRTLSGEPLTTT
jgi:hypothetical protein